jgi:diguanylate cyclase (GGDEF)-like protein
VTLAVLVMATLVVVVVVSAVIRRVDVRRLRRQARPPAPLRDALTGLPSRAWLEGRLDQVMARAERHGDLAAVLVLDLDRFAEINTRMGPEWGDAVLVQAARRLEELARTEDTVARLDGDEFAMLLEQVADASAPARVAQRIAETFRTPLRLGDDDASVSFSIGVAVYLAGGTSSRDLLRDASFAMRRARQKGEGRFEIFDPELGHQAVTRLVLEARLREAIAEGELVVHYQPQVLTKTGEIVGLEALVRWGHPTEGLLAPDRFIAAAEETGFIVHIDRWVMEEACRTAAHLERRGLLGPRFRMNVNVSADELAADRDFLEETSQVLAASGLAPQRLAVEITETSRGIEAFAPALGQLRLMGVGVALDDFGTGYSSLSRLRSLPVSTVKIDQEFVHGITDPANFAIVRAVTELAGVLDMDVVAEGIETPRQLELVRSAGCPSGQGNLFSAAVPDGELEALLRWGLPGTRGSGSDAPTWAQSLRPGVAEPFASRSEEQPDRRPPPAATRALPPR